MLYRPVCSHSGVLPKPRPEEIQLLKFRGDQMIEPTETHTGRTFFWLVVFATVLTSVLIWSGEKLPAASHGASADVPLVMRTDGGHLVVAVVKNKDVFTLEDTKDFLGLDLGKTISHIQVEAVYRYYIEMAKEWPIMIHGDTATVKAGEIKPQLPVAFDTKTMVKDTHSGWGRFNKNENLYALERSLSGRLEARAHGYKEIAIEPARKTVSEFVQTWLIKERPLAQGSVRRVEVLFPGEISSAQRASRPDTVEP
jgi:hypothetical protein